MLDVLRKQKKYALLRYAYVEHGKTDFVARKKLSTLTETLKTNREKTQVHVCASRMLFFFALLSDDDVARERKSSEISSKARRTPSRFEHRCLP